MEGARGGNAVRKENCHELESSGGGDLRISIVSVLKTVTVLTRFSKGVEKTGCQIGSRIVW